MGKILSIFVISMALACGGNVAPGTLSETIARNESQRLYDYCVQRRVRNQADLRRYCKKMYILYHANRAWENCINEGILDCGDRPRYEDIQ